MNLLDHFAWSSPSLEKAIEDLQRWSGVRARPGGSHPGMGTRNALVSLGPRLYLALDAPDPGQELHSGSNGERMASQNGYNMDLFAVATDDIEATRALFRSFGIESEIHAGSRDTPDGSEVLWRHLVTGQTPFGCALPHISQWDTDNHPALDAPVGCTLENFTVEHPSASKVAALYEALGLSIKVIEARDAALRVSLSGAHGVLDLPTCYTEE